MVILFRQEVVRNTGNLNTVNRKCCFVFSGDIRDCWSWKNKLGHLVASEMRPWPIAEFMLQIVVKEYFEFKVQPIFDGAG